MITAVPCVLLDGNLQIGLVDELVEDAAASIVRCHGRSKPGVRLLPLLAGDGLSAVIERILASQNRNQPHAAVGQTPEQPVVS